MEDTEQAWDRQQHQQEAETPADEQGERGRLAEQSKEKLWKELDCR